MCAFLFCGTGVNGMWERCEITFQFPSGYDFYSAQDSDLQDIDSMSHWYFVYTCPFSSSLLAIGKLIAFFAAYDQYF